ncbi:MAG: Gfo/Idh/MocA family oxidoreductase [Eubacterium sp.]|nr:Gfo/Idh/MocA family oxidoreductase [Eubacterium sp.]
MVRAGIIGFGYMGHFHLEKARHFHNVKVVSVYDIEEEKLKEAQAEGLAACRTLEEFLQSGIDLAVVATPNQWHYAYAAAAMRAGIHVACEKPAVLSAREMEQLIACARETGKFFTVHQQRRWDPDFRAVCEVVNSGRIGNVTTVESRVMGERGVCFGWRADPAAGGGMLYDWGVHLVDQMLVLFAGHKVASVYARMLSVLTPAVDDFFEVAMLFDHGVCAKLSVGTFALQKLPRWYVFGDRGTMRLDDFSGAKGGVSRIRGEVKGFDSVVGKKSLGPSRTMAPLRPEQVEQLEIPKQENMEMAFWENLVQAAEGREKPIVTTAQALRQLQVVEAAFLSAEKNEVIKTSI